jgi:hypothetical protein
MQILLAAKADVNVTDSADSTALHLAAAYGHNDAVAFLLRSGANATAEDEEGNTARDLALANGHTDTAAKLPAQ